MMNNVSEATSTSVLVLILSIVVSSLPLRERIALREEAREMFYHGYNNYINHAFPFDDLKPETCEGHNTWGSYSLTLIDSLDTLLVLGNRDEYVRVLYWIIENTSFDQNINVSVFETNIRVMGSLLSAHLLIMEGKEIQWEGYQGQLLSLANDLGKRLLPAFNTPTGIPYGTVNLRYGVPIGESKVTCSSGATSFSLEFGILSKLTGNPSFEKVAREAVRGIWNRRSPRFLIGNHINIFTGEWVHRDAGIGHGIDSFYEYLLKAAIYFGDQEYFSIFNEAYAAVVRNLKMGEFYIEVELYAGTLTWPTFNSLQAFWPSIQVLYGDLKNATQTARIFHLLWRQHGFTPEKVNLFTGRPLEGQEGYPLRPELIESIYYISRALPYDPHWFFYGRDILKQINRHCRMDCGYAAINKVSDFSLINRMDSFFLAETVKYLYLLFDENNWVNKGNYLFNTEAHIFPFFYEFMKDGQSLFTETEKSPLCAMISDRFLTFEALESPLFYQCSRFLEEIPRSSVSTDVNRTSGEASLSQSQQIRDEMDNSDHHHHHHHLSQQQKQPEQQQKSTLSFSQNEHPRQTTEQMDSSLEHRRYSDDTRENDLGSVHNSTEHKRNKEE